MNVYFLDEILWDTMQTEFVTPNATRPIVFRTCAGVQECSRKLDHLFTHSSYVIQMEPSEYKVVDTVEVEINDCDPYSWTASISTFE